MREASKRRVLLVDDERTLGESLKEILEAKGYQVTYVEDGDYALDLVEEEDFDAVVTDFEMPTMGGMELLEKARKFKPRLPIIIMTAFSSSERAIEATKCGAYDFLIKPVEIPELLDTLKKAIASGRLTAKSITLGSTASGQDAIIGNSHSMLKVFQGNWAHREEPHSRSRFR